MNCSKRTSDFVFVVNFVDRFVKVRPVKERVRQVEAKIFNKVAEQNLDEKR